MSPLLFTDKKSSYKNKPLTPFIDNMFLTSSLFVSLISKISTGPVSETFFPGKNFKEFGLGVFSVCTNIRFI